MAEQDAQLTTELAVAEAQPSRTEQQTRLPARRQEAGSLVPSGEEWEMWIKVAKTLLDGGFASASFKSPEQLLAAFLMGREMGIGPIESKDNLLPMNGRLAPSSALQLSQAYKRLPLFDHQVLESTDKVCRIRARRSPAHSWHEETWTIEEAAQVKIGDTGKRLTEKDNWRNYAKDMLYNRCLGRVLARVVPDVTGPARYAAEVVQDFEPQRSGPGTVIDATNFKEVE